MPREHVIEIDASRPLVEERRNGHNRWHEAIEPAAEVEPGDTVVYETRDAFDIQLDSHSTAEDVGKAKLGPVHPLTGPVFVKGAEPGDLLEHPADGEGLGHGGVDGRGHPPGQRR